MRVKARLTAAVAAVTAGTLVAALGPAVPAQAIPAPTGSFASVASTVLRTIDSDDCQDMVRLDIAVNLPGLGDAIAAQGYTTAASGYKYGGTDPVYTELVWSWEATISGPDNY